MVEEKRDSRRRKTRGQISPQAEPELRDVFFTSIRPRFASTQAFELTRNTQRVKRSASKLEKKCSGALSHNNHVSRSGAWSVVMCEALN